ncbi:hypothetical protein [Tateyamaria sp. syn59]|uniref:hypothetical protein n=1 Tax=Tateyamaria sp. syn59 TaxID=2576942 RepID=UPI0011BE18F9|nr:hypothetical protein [Tateyamaria sp. syn59]
MDSRLVRLTADGLVPDVGIDTSKAANVATFNSSANGAAFAYQMGRVRGTDQFLGVAGVLPNSQVGGAPTSATATYRGDYSLAYADRNTFEQSVTGNIVLNADFNQGTLVGQAGGLSVNGSINGQSLGGTASYRGVDAPLTGRIGNTRAVGAFAGNTNDQALVGGFLADRQRNP